MDKKRLSGSAINELEVNGRWHEMRQRAEDLLIQLKSKEKKKKYIKINKHTYVSEGWFEMMINRKR